MNVRLRSLLLPHSKQFQQLSPFRRNVYFQWTRFAPPLPGVLGLKGGSCSVVRAHLFKILNRYLNEHTDLRDTLVDHQSFHRAEQAHAFLQTVRDRYGSLSERAWEAAPSSSYPDSSWYRRHWKGQAKVREAQSGSALPPAAQSVEERKVQMKKRIAELQEQKKARTRTLF